MPIYVNEINAETINEIVNDQRAKRIEIAKKTGRGGELITLDYSPPINCLIIEVDGKEVFICPFTSSGLAVSKYNTLS